MQVEVTPEQKKFFERLTLRAELDDSVEIRVIETPAKGEKNVRHREFIPHDRIIERIPSILQKWNLCNIYFSPALRKNHNGTKEGVSHIPWLWADIDFKRTPKEQAEKIISELPIKPSVIVFTGGGYHLYWFLKDPLFPEDITKTEALLKRLSLSIDGDEGVCDISHVMRFPGSINRKPDRGNAVVKIIELNEGEANVEDFESILPSIDISQAEEFQSEKQSEHLEKIIKCRFLQHCDKDRAVLPEPEWYAMVCILSKEPGGRDLIHSLSRGYPGYSVQETDQKILHSLEAGPTTCQRVQSLWDCGLDCGVKSPAALPYKEAIDEADKGKKSGPELKLTTIADILEYPNLTFLIEDILPEETIDVIGGYTGTGKSIIILEIIKSVVTGNRLFGKYAVNRTGPVLIIDEETPRPLLRDRIQKMKFDPSWPIYFLHFQGIKVDKESVFNALMERIKEVKPVLVVFDSLIRIHRKREKESEEMAQVIDALRKIANLGITVIPIHHHKKGGGPLTEKLRGSSDIPGGIDVEFALTSEKEGSDILLFQSVKTRIKPFPPIRLKLNITEDTATVECYGTKNETILEIIISVISEETDFLTVNQIIKKLIDKKFDEFKEYEIRKALKEGERLGTLMSSETKIGKTRAMTYKVK